MSASGPFSDLGGWAPDVCFAPQYLCWNSRSRRTGKRVLLPSTGSLQQGEQSGKDAACNDAEGEILQQR